MEDRPVRWLNELEYIDGKIWANLYTSDEIVIIDPKDGHIEGVINCKGLLPEKISCSMEECTSGTAELRISRSIIKRMRKNLIP